ncbi:HlyD family secretion protein [Bradyrhizobium sp. URHC0002]
MIIILCLYVVALWAVFSKFKLVRWGWLSGTVSLLIGGFILATFLALFNYLTPSGRVTVTGRVVEVTPNVTGQIVAIPVKPNVPAKASDVLFQIDPAPFQYKVAQLQAQLDHASWELSQATIRAPADGYVTLVTVTVGDRALQMHSAMSFIVENEITLVGMFSQNGFQTIKEGTAVDIVFDNAPGRIYHARITAIPKGIGQGQVAVSGTLARTNVLGGATVFPAVISDGMNRDQLRLGMSGSATAFAGNAGVIGLLASILVWVGSCTAYL